MKIISNKKFLLHNPESEAEGAYRIKRIINNSTDVVEDGEEYITLVHTGDYLKK